MIGENVGRVDSHVYHDHDFNLEYDFLLYRIIFVQIYKTILCIAFKINILLYSHYSK